MDKVKVWFSNLTVAGKSSVIAAVALGGLFGAGAMSDGGTPSTEANTDINLTEQVKPTITTKTETKTKAIAFKKLTRKDSSVAKGVKYIESYGIKGENLYTYKVTLTDNEETDRKLTSKEVISKPINQITIVGTYVKPKPEPKPSTNCDSNYTGCVPIAYDVDCGGGSGNGPEYVYGSVRVIGSDIYGLDYDGDGVGCE